MKNLSYEVNPKSLSWWQKLSTMQLPWEWVENSAPQQVLSNVSFNVKSGQMLAIMGNSGMFPHEDTTSVIDNDSNYSRTSMARTPLEP